MSPETAPNAHTRASPVAVEQLTKRFGGVTAVNELTFTHDTASVLGLIGPNGAGKTTVFNLLSGLLPPTAGRIHINGVDVTGARPDQVASTGVARTFQNLQIFHNLSVLENVYVACVRHIRGGLVGAMLGRRAVRRSEANAREHAAATLDRVGLSGDHYDMPAGALPYGMQRRLEIARALVTDARLLLLDEPLAGLSRAESSELLALVTEVARGGVAVLLVEHDVASVMDISSRVLVLDHGTLLADGPPDVVRTDPRVRTAYLGEGLE